jgi:carbonic anhydrase
VLYGVFNLHNHQVCMPVNPLASPSEENVRLAYAPTNPREFSALTVQMAQILQPEAQRAMGPAVEAGNGRRDGQPTAPDVTSTPGLTSRATGG